MKRVVLDSTILVSAFLVPGGAARKLLNVLHREEYHLVLCNDILIETARALLMYARIRKRYFYADDDVHRYLRGIEATSDSVRPFPLTVSRDPNDDMILGCALAGDADTIITRDKDLLVLKNYKNILIIAPEESIALLQSVPRQ